MVDSDSKIIISFSLNPRHTLYKQGRSLGSGCLKPMYSYAEFQFNRAPEMSRQVVLNLFGLVEHSYGKKSLAAHPSIKTDQNDEYSIYHSSLF